jgi:hypothetical protein
VVQAVIRNQYRYGFTHVTADVIRPICQGVWDNFYAQPPEVQQCDWEACAVIERYNMLKEFVKVREDLSKMKISTLDECREERKQERQLGQKVKSTQRIIQQDTTIANGETDINSWIDCDIVNFFDQYSAGGAFEMEYISIYPE